MGDVNLTMFNETAGGRKVPAPTPTRIWCLDDDDRANDLVRTTLEMSYQLDFVEDLPSLRSRVFSDRPRPELLVAELKLRGGSFLDYLRDDKFVEQLAVPVVVLSSVEDVDVMRLCFARGVADYLLKPTRRVELIAKIERAVSSRTAVLGVRLDPITLSARRAGISSPPLTPKEYQVLTVLLTAGTAPVSPARLRETLWRDTQVSAKALDVHLSHLRKKIVALGLRIERVQKGLVLVGPEDQTPSEGV